MESFCGSKLWDLNVTWYTENPDFTPCFEKTILVWVPAGFLWIFASFELFNALRSQKRNEYKSLLHECILFFTLFLILLNFSRFLYTFVHFIDPSRNDGTKIYPVDYIAPAIRTATYALAFYIRRLNNSKGIRISGTLFSFWALSVCGDFFEVQTNVRTLPLDLKDDQQVWTFVVLMISFPIEVLLVVLNCFCDGEVDRDCVQEQNEACPQLRASIPSRVLFHWVWPLVKVGYKKPVAFSDLWLLHPENKATTVFDHFQQYWLPEFTRCQKYNKELQEQEELLALSRGGLEGEADNEVLIQVNAAKKKKLKRKTAGILLPIWKCHWKTYLYGTSLMLLSTAASFAAPLILDLIIQHVNSDEQSWKGYFYSVLMLAASVVQFLLYGHRFIAMQLIGIRVKNALSSAVYRKSVLLSNSARKESTTGEIVNLMSIDSQRFCDLLTYLNSIWVSPTIICVATYLLYKLLGYSVFAGLAILILLVPVTAAIMHFREKLQGKQMKFKDQRVKMVNEVLSGIKVLKFYAWETSFENEIRNIREEEMNVMKKMAYIDAFNEFVWYTAPFVVTLVTFATFVLSDASHILDARKAFVSLTLFNMIRWPMYAMPWVLTLLVQTKVSRDRLNKFLNAEEINPEDVTHWDAPDGVTINDASFSWGEKDDENMERAILRNITLKVQKGSLVAVVGVVGAGKSSLLSAVLGEMRKMRGDINTSGSIAYVSQQAWIQNETLRGNILFGKPFDDATYSKITKACALMPDIEILPAGDKTEIGEKGINLSGGQKQRVALARAVYHNADMYLLDDPLSAVDAHVSKQLFEKVIGPQGLLSRKTRVVVTHGLTYLPQMDCIVVMKSGEISEIGTFHELLKKKGDFADFLTEYIKPEDLDELEANDGVFEQLEDLDGIKETIARRKRLISHVSDASDGPSNKYATSPKHLPTGSKNVPETEQAKMKNSKDKLIEEEKSEVGTVDRKVFLYYLRNLGLGVCITTVIFHMTLNGATLASNIWLSMWSMEPPAGNGTQNISKRDMYLSVYGVLGISQAVSIFVATLSITLGSLSAAKFIHNEMLRRILRSPMTFFDTTPLGRIVNRFSKDTDIADSNFPIYLRSWLNCIFEVLVIVIGICYSTPWILIVFIPITILYYGIQRFYVATSRQVRRLESVSRSPIYAHFSETLAGTSTIRAFSSESQFIKEAYRTLDSNMMAYYPILISNRWLDVWLESLASIVIFFAALLAINTRPDAGVVGLSLSYALNMVNGFNWLVRFFSLVETNAVAIERLKEYTEVAQEAPWEISSQIPPHHWPQYGAISFKNYQTRYREGLDLVLKNVTCTICPGEKVGIVGRTGAGKSSMALSLFRIIEAAGGSISIDGVDISQLGLHDLRGNLTIIPQDPVLFAGELRANLDPFKKYSDLDIWRALEFAHLKEAVNGFSGGLLHEISEGGENLSVGQRQLVCLARALLRKSKILILDEATAAVDLETDDLIQQTIREEFRDNTVLTIAHRLNTIMDYNKVIVLDNGEIVEFDEPKALLQNTETIFYGMAKNAGVA